MDKNIGHTPGLTIHRHASPGIGSVNTWWIETADAVVLIDAQRQISQAQAVARAVTESGKPVRAILLTHPHPDHVGGLPALRAAFPDAPLHATRKTAEVLRTDEGGLFALTRSFLGADFAASMPDATDILAESGNLDIAGLRFDYIEFGVGETVAACVFSLPDQGVAFVGDIVANGMTPWLLEGHTGLWLEQVDRLASMLAPDVIAYPGHGSEAALGMLATAQRDYIDRFRALVARSAIDGRLTPAGRQAVVAEMDRHHPGWVPVAGVPDLLAKNADGVARELNIAVDA